MGHIPLHVDVKGARLLSHLAPGGFEVHRLSIEARVGFSALGADATTGEEGHGDVQGDGVLIRVPGDQHGTVVHNIKLVRFRVINRSLQREADPRKVGRCCGPGPGEGRVLAELRNLQVHVVLMGEVEPGLHPFRRGVDHGEAVLQGPEVCMGLPCEHGEGLESNALRGVEGEAIGDRRIECGLGIIDVRDGHQAHVEALLHLLQLRL